MLCTRPGWSHVFEERPGHEELLALTCQSVSRAPALNRLEGFTEDRQQRNTRQGREDRAHGGAGCHCPPAGQLREDRPGLPPHRDV